MIQLYLLNVVAAIVIFVMSFVLVKKRKKIGIFLLPGLYLISQIVVFLTTYKPEKISDSVVSINMAEIVKQNFILGIILSILMVVALFVIDKKLRR